MGKLDGHFLQETKGKLDVDLLGVASVEKSGSMELREKAASLLPGVRSVLVLGKEIFQEVVALLGPSKGAGEADYGELLKPHGDYINGRLTRAVHELASLFRREGYQSLPLPAAGCPTDHRLIMAVFSYKHAAKLAGLGSIGWHSMLITPEYGPRVKLACVLTEAPLEPSPLRDEYYCRDCGACIQQCPALALQEPRRGESYFMNKFACQTYRNAGLTCGVCMKVCDEVLR